MMGGGAGMMQHAKQAMEANRNLLKSKSIYERMKDLGNSKSRTIYKYNESTPEMLASIRAYKEAENKRIFKKQIILGVICTGLFLGIMWMLFYY